MRGRLSRWALYLKKNNFKEPGCGKIGSEIIFEGSKQSSQNNFAPHRAPSGENTNERNGNKRHWRRGEGIHIL